jgi:hypothetical protein
VPEIIDPVFAKTSQNARFLLSENERFGLVFVKTGSINSGTGSLNLQNELTEPLVYHQPSYAKLPEYTFEKPKPIHEKFHLLFSVVQIQRISPIPLVITRTKSKDECASVEGFAKD